MEHGQKTDRSPIALRADEVDTQGEIVIKRASLDGFVWPPKPSTPTEPSVEIEQSEPGMSGLGVLVDSIETTLLGRNGLSFARRAARDGWAPNAEDVYCWRCGGGVGMHETDGEGCGSCRNTKLYWDQAIRLGAYEGLVRDAVLDLKFHRWRTSGNELGRAMGHAIRGRMERIGVMPDEVVLVPIPISWRRRVTRGVDHTGVLARGAAGVIGCRCERVLQAIHRPEQVGLSMTARGRNIKGAFRVRGGVGPLNPGIRVIVLVDDVRTTGATMTAACKAIRGAELTGNGAEIWAATAGVSGLGARDRRILKNSGPGGDDF